MTASDLTTQIQQLDQRLAQVEATLLRIEHMLVELQAAPTDPSGAPGTAFASLSPSWLGRHGTLGRLGCERQ